MTSVELMPSDDVEVVGELAPFSATPTMTPEAVRATVAWQAELLRSVLEDKVDYGVIPGTPKPSLWKPGAEKLLKAHGFGHYFEPIGGLIERDDNGQRIGVTYRCVVTKPVGERDVTVATCEGYCGYDDKSRRANDPWNTIVKMAQKRALVGATLQATGTSGLLTQDLEDYHEAGDGSLAALVADVRRRARALPDAPRATLAAEIDQYGVKVDQMPVADLAAVLVRIGELSVPADRKETDTTQPASEEQPSAPSIEHASPTPQGDDAAGNGAGGEKVASTGPPDPARITRPQETKLHAGFGNRDRADRLRVLSAFVGRDLGTMSDMTKAEAHDAIERRVWEQ